MSFAGGVSGRTSDAVDVDELYPGGGGDEVRSVRDPPSQLSRTRAASDAAFSVRATSRSLATCVTLTPSAPRRSKRLSLPRPNTTTSSSRAAISFRSLAAYPFGRAGASSVIAPSEATTVSLDDIAPMIANASGIDVVTGYRGALVSSRGGVRTFAKTPPGNPLAHRTRNGSSRRRAKRAMTRCSWRIATTAQPRKAS